MPEIDPEVWRRKRREAQEAALRRLDDAMVEVPIWALEAARSGRMCKVCVGQPPSWDGHDLLPRPCQGAGAQRVLMAYREATS